MEPQKPRITLYERRSFGNKLNASFDFIKENWKPLFKFSTYLLLPLSLIQGLSLNGLIGGMTNLGALENSDAIAGLGSLGVTFLLHYSLYILLFIIGNIGLSALVLALVKSYNEREDRLLNITLKELKPLLLYNAKRVFLAGLAAFIVLSVVLFVVALFAAISVYTMILTLPCFIACLVPLLLLTPIYVLEKISLGDAVFKAYRLGFPTWGGIFLIALVMGIIANVLQGVFTAPWYIAFLVKYFFMMSDAANVATVSPWYAFMLYVFAVIQVFGTYLSMIFCPIGVVYQYGHASEVVDSVKVEEDIDNFENL
ncbi:MAG: hypothetical protein ACK5ND_06255 [Bacteroides sp.]